MSKKTNALFTAAGLAVVVVYTAEMARPAVTFVPGWPSYDWPTPDGFGGTHHSPLSDITAKTVEYLEVAWTYRTGDVHDRSDGMAGTAYKLNILFQKNLYWPKFQSHWPIQWFYKCLILFDLTFEK